MIGRDPTARDAKGAASAPASVNVTVTWRTLESEEEATAATAELVDVAKMKLDTDPDAALVVVSGACTQLDNFEEQERAARLRRRQLLSSTTQKRKKSASEDGTGNFLEFPKEDCEGRSLAQAITRSSLRSVMLDVVKLALEKLPESPTLMTAAMAAVAAVLGAPCETDNAVRVAGMQLVTDIIESVYYLGDASSVSAGGSSRIPGELSDDAATAAMAALSGAVARGGLAANFSNASSSDGGGGGGGDFNVTAAILEANAREHNATQIVRAAMTLSIVNAVAGEKARSATSLRIFYSAQRVVAKNVTKKTTTAAATAANGNATTETGTETETAGTNFVVPAGALWSAATGAGFSPSGVNRMQVTFYFDAHSADATNRITTTTTESTTSDTSRYRDAEKTSGTVSLSFQVPVISTVAAMVRRGGGG